jgi:hypothetical protein
VPADTAERIGLVGLVGWDRNHGQHRAQLTSTAQIYIRADSRMVAAIGVEDLLTVETPTLCWADRPGPDVKKVVD